MITRKVDRIDSRAGFAFRWIQEFASQVEHLDVICLETGDLDGLPRNCSVVAVGGPAVPRYRTLSNFFRAALKIVPYVDGIFSHQNPEYGIAIAPFAQWYRKPLIAWYTHGTVTLRLRLLTVLADKLVTASRDSFKLVTPKLTVLHHGIDTGLFVPSAVTPQHPTIVTVGRISRSKNVQLVIEAAASLRHEIAGVRVVIAGATAIAEDESYLTELHELVRRLDLMDVVRFTGAVPYAETVRIYHEATVFVNFSDTASLDKAVLEALSCGVPVVTSNIAFRDRADHVERCVFVPKELSSIVGALAEELRSAVTEKQCAEMHEYVVKEHGLSSTIRSILKMYSKQP